MSCRLGGAVTDAETTLTPVSAPNSEKGVGSTTTASRATTRSTRSRRSEHRGRPQEARSSSRRRCASSGAVHDADDQRRCPMAARLNVNVVHRPDNGRGRLGAIGSMPTFAQESSPSRRESRRAVGCGGVGPARSTQRPGTLRRATGRGLLKTSASIVRCGGMPSMHPCLDRRRAHRPARRRRSTTTAGRRPAERRAHARRAVQPSTACRAPGRGDVASTARQQLAVSAGADPRKVSSRGDVGADRDRTRSDPPGGRTGLAVSPRGGAEHDAGRGRPRRRSPPASMRGGTSCSARREGLRATIRAAAAGPRRH